MCRMPFVLTSIENLPPGLQAEVLTIALILNAVSANDVPDRMRWRIVKSDRIRHQRCHQQESAHVAAGSGHRRMQGHAAAADRADIGAASMALIAFGARGDHDVLLKSFSVHCL